MKAEVLARVADLSNIKMRYFDLLAHVRREYLIVSKNIYLARGPPEAIFIINSDICGDLPIEEMVAELAHHQKAHCLLLTTEATREQSKNFGCVS
jgi:hypothetical protein